MDGHMTQRKVTWHNGWSHDTIGRSHDTMDGHMTQRKVTWHNERSHDTTEGHMTNQQPIKTRKEGILHYIRRQSFAHVSQDLSCISWITVGNRYIPTNSKRYVLIPMLAAWMHGVWSIVHTIAQYVDKVWSLLVCTLTYWNQSYPSFWDAHLDLFWCDVEFLGYLLPHRHDALVWVALQWKESGTDTTCRLIPRLYSKWWNVGRGLGTRSYNLITQCITK